MELTEVQMFVIAVLASVIVYALNLAVKYAGYSIGRGWLSVIVYVFAGGLAVLWGAPVFPAFPAYAGDPAAFVGVVFAYLGAVLTALGPIVAFATVLYNALLKAVLDKLADQFKLRIYQ